MKLPDQWEVAAWIMNAPDEEFTAAEMSYDWALDDREKANREKDPIVRGLLRGSSRLWASVHREYWKKGIKTWS